jgi:hypothetical protein
MADAGFARVSSGHGGRASEDDHLRSPGRSEPGTGPAILLADDTCTDVLSQVMAGACHDLAPSRWLIPGPDARRRILPGCFRLLIEHALASGIVHTTAGQDAVALWLPAGCDPAPPPGGYGERLAAVTGPWTDRFRIASQALERRHPAGIACHYLAILAVRPDRQGLGSALLRARHAALDRDGLPAYLHAPDLRTRRLFLAHGYDACGGLVVLPGTLLFPMLRQPHPGTQASPGALEPAPRHPAITPVIRQETRP